MSKAVENNKIDSIEQTVAKNNIRNNIARQFEQYISTLKKVPQIMNVASLAAKEWMFEYGLLNTLRHSFILKNIPELHFISAEKEKKIATKSFENMPINATVLHGMFSDIFQSPYKTAKVGWSYLTEAIKDYQSPIQYSLIWADYCSYANVRLLEDFVNAVEHNITEGLIYITFCLSEKHGAHKKSLKALKKYSKSNGEDICKVTSDAIKYFAKQIKGKKVEKVFEVIYGGGSTLGTSMVTVGFSVNLYAKNIKPLFFDDTEWKPEDKLKRQMVVYNHLSKHGGWKEKRIGRPRKTYQPNPKTIARRKENQERKNAWDKLRKKIIIRVNRGWEDSKIYNDLREQLDKINKKFKSVVSVRAWLSPNLAKKATKTKCEIA